MQIQAFRAICQKRQKGEGAGVKNLFIFCGAVGGARQSAIKNPPELATTVPGDGAHLF